MITLVQLKAKHFDTRPEYQAVQYADSSDCPIARAIKEQLKAKVVEVSLDTAHTNSSLYGFPYYGFTMYKMDSLAARDKEPEEVIREIPLKSY